MIEIEVAVSTNLECAHRDESGRLHGHSYVVEVWIPAGPNLDAFRESLTLTAAGLDHTLLEESLGSSRMEDIGAWFLRRIATATRVAVRRPTLGYAIEARRAARVSPRVPRGLSA